MTTSLRQQLGVSDPTFLLAFAGRVVGWKGLSVAIDAIAQLRDEDVKLLIIGAGDALEQLKNKAMVKGVAEQVIFHQPVEHAMLPEFYAACDAGVFPSIGDEAFGITIAEAMACGKPVIASYIGGIPEVVGNEQSAGLLVTPGDVTAMVKAINHLRALPDRGKAMGENARQRIASHYTWQHSAQRLLQALKTE